MITLLLCAKCEQIDDCDDTACVCYGSIFGGMCEHCLSVVRVNRWRNVMVLLLCAEGEQMEECDDNACV